MKDFDMFGKDIHFHYKTPNLVFVTLFFQFLKPEI